jgi:hypothetical protein
LCFSQKNNEDDGLVLRIHMLVDTKCHHLMKLDVIHICLPHETETVQLQTCFVLLICERKEFLYHLVQQQPKAIVAQILLLLQFHQLFFFNFSFVKKSLWLVLLYPMPN